MKPTFRTATKKAIDTLADELNLPNNITMQDWTYEIANDDGIKKYIFFYGLLKDEDEKFALMQIIIQATEDQPNEEQFEKYCNTIKPLLITDFKIHEYSIYYWCCFENENIEDCWKISAIMRELWNAVNTKENTAPFTL
jgi:predicted ATP-dependent endonuclease of OLD family